MNPGKEVTTAGMVVGILALSILGALVRVLLRLGEASPLCSDASFPLQAMAVWGDLTLLVIFPLGVGWWEFRKQVLRSALWRGLGIALPLLIAFYALFTAWRHPCVFGW